MRSIRLVSADEAGCPILKKLKAADNYEPYIVHVQQQHIDISSLPRPSEPHSFPSFPIEFLSGSLPFDVKEVANLWLQLLAIQIQNGNFVRYSNLIRERPRARLSDGSNTDQLTKDKEKTLLFIRHKFQKGFLSQDHSPKAGDMPSISGYLQMLEKEYSDPETDMVFKTKTHKVLEAIAKSESIPRDEEFNFRSRCQGLLDKWSEPRGPQSTKQEASPYTESTLKQEPVNQSPGAEVDREQMETPVVCLTQMSPEQCAKLESISQACNTPIDRAAIELMCTLPYFTDSNGQNHHFDYQVAPQARLVGYPDISYLNSTLDRLLNYGPTLPPQMLQLTSWTSAWYGTALLIDTRAGEVVELKDYEPLEGGLCTKLEGLRTPVEETLREWIDHFLTMKWIPGGGEDILTEEWRSMHVLRHKRLLQEYNWPASFPLPTDKFHDFLKRKDELHSQWLKGYESNESNRPMLRKWSQLVREWRRKEIQYESGTNEHEGPKHLDDKIGDVFKYNYEQKEDREYSNETGALMLEKYRKKIILQESGASGSTWSIEVTPDKMLKRFALILEASPDARDEVTKEMEEVLNAAYERYKNPDYKTELLGMPDNDSTSDYEMSEDECMEEEEFESDEDMDDLDAAILEADMKMDVEALKGGYTELVIR